MSAIDRLEEQVSSLKVRASNAKRAAEEQLENALHTVETLAGAGAVGFMEGSGRTVEIFGLDTSQTVGGALLVASLAVDDKGLSGHLRALGAGSLAAFAYKKGKEMGEANPST